MKKDNSRSSFSKPATRSSTPPAKPAPAKSAPVSTVARNSPIPRPSPMKREITQEMIAKRAYEIFASGKGGSQTDNWFQAERELKGA
jgi:hypothetical protein